MANVKRQHRWVVTPPGARGLGRPGPRRVGGVGSTTGYTGMGAVELVVSMAVVGVLLGGVVLVSESLRAGTSDQQTRATLCKLREATDAYREQHGDWPPCSSTALCIESLLADAVSGPMVRSLRLSADSQGDIYVHDGYGQPIRCISGEQSQTAKPDFVSAGPDGRFGDLASSLEDEINAAMDNLYSSDLEEPTP